MKLCLEKFPTLLSTSYIEAYLLSFYSPQTLYLLPKGINKRYLPFYYQILLPSGHKYFLLFEMEIIFSEIVIKISLLPAGNKILPPNFSVCTYKFWIYTRRVIQEGYFKPL